MQSILFLRVFSCGQFHVWAQTTDPNYFDKEFSKQSKHLSCALLRTKYATGPKCKVINMMIIIKSLSTISEQSNT